MAVAAGTTSAQSVATRVSQKGSGPGRSRTVTPPPGRTSDGGHPRSADPASWAPVSLRSERSVITSTLPRSGHAPCPQRQFPSKGVLSARFDGNWISVVIQDRA